MSAPACDVASAPAPGAETSEPQFGIYLHWPYCAAICPYCDFNVYRARRADEGALLEALARDIRGWRARTGPRPVDTVFFGGGTPSRLAPLAIADLLAVIDEAFGLSVSAEISLEANPEDADAERFAGFAAAGVNRLSLGVQALDAAALKALGRAHTTNDARRAVALAADAVPQVSLDLIYAREGQPLAAWERELTQALSLGAGHISAYQLTIEPGTAFARRVARGALVPPGPDSAADFYILTQEIAEAAGFPAYEISNHARADGGGVGAQARHNRLYWTSREWAGVGPGAHGRLGALGAGDGVRRATTAARRPQDYIQTVGETGWGVVMDEALSAQEQLDEALLMGLRLRAGLDWARLAPLFRTPLEPAIWTPLVEAGLLEPTAQGVRVSDAARALTDRIAADLSDALSDVL